MRKISTILAFFFLMCSVAAVNVEARGPDDERRKERGPGQIGQPHSQGGGARPSSPPARAPEIRRSAPPVQAPRPQAPQVSSPQPQRRAPEIQRQVPSVQRQAPAIQRQAPQMPPAVKRPAPQPNVRPEMTQPPVRRDIQQPTMRRETTQPQLRRETVRPPSSPVPGKISPQGPPVERSLRQRGEAPSVAPVRPPKDARDFFRSRIEQSKRPGAGPSSGIQPQPGQSFRRAPTEGDLQRFLKLPRRQVRPEGGPGGAKIGAAVLGGAAGAVALDHFLNRGRPPADPGVSGYFPGKGHRPHDRLTPEAAHVIRERYPNRYPATFTRDWRAHHPNLGKYYWHQQVWPHRPWNYWWRPASWVALSSWIVWNWGSPLFYDYGSNFYYDNGYVYLNGRRICSAVDYYDQAVRIIVQTPEVKDDADDWISLGVFALTRDPATESGVAIQLAVNKDGVIQGTYYNADNDVTKPIKGMVEKETQRAVWTFADENGGTIIMETGVYNLTLDQTGVLVHLDNKQTEQWFLVRLKEPVAEE